MPDVKSEKRREPRAPAEGAVRIVLNQSGAEEIVGRLMDVSASGFRAAHNHAALPKGRTVKFQHAAAWGQARVIWNRITPDAIETGFLIL